MRLQLTRHACGLTTAIGLLAFASRADAQEEIEKGHGNTVTKLGIYSDDDATTVVTSLVDGKVAVRDNVTIGTHALIDAVTSASVDVTSAATPQFHEVRVEAGARAAFRAPHEVDVNLGLSRSAENDWKSHSLQIGVAREVAQKNARLAASYSYTDNAVGRSGDPTFKESLGVHTAELGVSQLIDRKTLASATYTMQKSSGWHSSPYRYVTTMSGVSVLESHPSTRSRHALTLRGVRSLGEEIATELSYRLYRDDWGVLSHTVTSSLHYAPGERWDVRLRARMYAQGAAHFWRKRYENLMTYVSADRELSTFWNMSGSAKLTRRAGPLVVDVKVDLIQYWFPDFDLLARRTALVSSAGVGYQW